VLAVAALLAVAAHVFAVETIEFVDSSAEDFQKGKTENTRVGVDGALTLAREQTTLLDGVEHAWCAAVAPGGAVYVGAVPEGDVYRIADGKAEKIFESGEAGVFALAILPGGDVAVGTGSNGRIFRLTPGGTSSLMADLDETYVFALAVGSDGALYAATGGGFGRVYRIADVPELVYDSPGEHLLALAVSPGGKVFASSGDNGAVYELDVAGGGARVLFGAAEGVVQALAVAPDGVVYAGTAAIAKPKPGAEKAAIRSIVSQMAARAADAPTSATPPSPPAKQSFEATNSVYAIAPGGEVRRVFAVKKGLVLSLLVEGGRLMAGTSGEKAGIYEIDVDDEAGSLLFETESDAVHALTAHPAGGFAAGLGVPGAAIYFADGYAKKGSFTSRVMDAPALTKWGACRWEGQTPFDAKLTFKIRSGNSPRPDVTWTDWSVVDASGEGAAAELPPSRYIQYRIEMAGASPQATPSLRRVGISGLPMNLAPRVTEIKVGKQAKEPPGRNGKKPEGPNGAAGSAALSDSVVIAWKAADPNNDNLEFALSFRESAMKRPVPLEDDLDKPQYQWDTTSVPDGEYYFTIEASDSPSNPPGASLVSSKEEGPFTIDNTGPRIDRPSVSGAGGGYSVKVSAADAASRLKEASYSVDGGEWVTLSADDGIFDSEREAVTIDVTKPGAAIAMVRFVDAADNASAVTVIFESE
jgi:hypothetical protein